jgi:23S rRNA pseudouridine2605 synthase
VQRLLRTTIGPVHLGDMRAGKMRPLTAQELSALFAAVGM